MANATTEMSYPIQWSEGMLLSPQHFQQNDVYWEQQMHAKTSMTQPYSWGISHVAIDETKLLDGTLSILELDALLPDGLVVRYRASEQDLPLVFSIKKTLKTVGKTSLTVQLMVPRRSEGAASNTSPVQRFDSVAGGMVVDENTGEGEIPINRLRPRIHLSADEPLPKYASMPLFVVKQGSEGGYQLGNYVPPMLKLAAMNQVDELCLQKKLSKLLSKIRKKAIQLSGVNAGQEDLPGLLVSEQHAAIIRHMVACLPELEVSCASGEAHPFDVYKSLAAMIGQISAINQRDIVPPLLPDYSHDDLYRAFYDALNEVYKIVNEISLAYSSVNFSEQEDGTFSIPMDKNWLSRELFIELVFKSGQSKEQVKKWMKQARVGSSSVLKLLGERRLPGASLAQVQSSEKLGLKEKSNTLLYSLENAVLETRDKKVPVIKPGQKLYVKGEEGTGAPMAIILHIATDIGIGE